MTTTPDDPRFTALVAMIGRTGAEEFGIRYDTPDDPDEGPTAWIAWATYKRGGLTIPQLAGDLDPVAAVYALASKLVDGGKCQHCQRPTGITLDPDPMPAEAFVCWYQFDPELATFRRACEGN